MVLFTFFCQISVNFPEPESLNLKEMISLFVCNHQINTLKTIPQSEIYGFFAHHSPPRDVRIFFKILFQSPYCITLLPHDQHFDSEDITRANHRKSLYWSVSAFILLPCVPIKIRPKKNLHLIKKKRGKKRHPRALRAAFSVLIHSVLGIEECLMQVRCVFRSWVSSISLTPVLQPWETLLIYTVMLLSFLYSAGYIFMGEQSKSITSSASCASVCLFDPPPFYNHPYYPLACRTSVALWKKRLVRTGSPWSRSVSSTRSSTTSHSSTNSIRTCCGSWSREWPNGNTTHCLGVFLVHVCWKPCVMDHVSCLWNM